MVSFHVFVYIYAVRNLQATDFELLLGLNLVAYDSVGALVLSQVTCAFNLNLLTGMLM